MPRKAKDEEENKKKVTTVKEPNKSNSSKVSSSKKVGKEVEKESTSINKKVKKATSSRTTAKKSSTTKSKATTAKSSTAKKSTAKKTSTASKSSTKKSTVAKSATKKSVAKKSSTKRTPAKRTTRKKTTAITPMEYYDLPVVYNRTIVKILAQTPFSLFVYWEVSEEDRKILQEQHGEYIFHNTKPYLVITNETMNYSFEVEINDYANSWYVHIQDSDCKYSVQLIRKTINYNNSIPSSVINIISSNEISMPNDHILFDKLGKTVFFRNVKNNYVIEKDISSLSFISNIGRVYNIYDLYKEIYKNELNGDELGVTLSSSGFSSNFR